MTMKARTLLIGISAAMLVGCQGQDPADNGGTSQPEAIEAANLVTAPAANDSGENVGSAMPVPPAAADPKSCEAEVGRLAAADLVRRCLNVSPATHPPCNAANSCDMIKQEIDRSCAMFGDDKPADCKAAGAE